MKEMNPYRFTPSDDEREQTKSRRPFPYDFVALVVCCLFLPALVPARTTDLYAQSAYLEAAFVWLPTAAVSAWLAIRIVRNGARNWAIRATAALILLAMIGFLYEPALRLM